MISWQKTLPFSSGWPAITRMAFIGSLAE